jgi:hypothetical protein
LNIGILTWINLVFGRKVSERAFSAYQYKTFVPAGVFETTTPFIELMVGLQSFVFPSLLSSQADGISIV